MVSVTVLPVSAVPLRVGWVFVVCPSPGVPVSEATASPIVGVVGATVSTVNVAVAGVDTLPAASVLVTLKPTVLSASGAISELLPFGACCARSMRHKPLTESARVV